MQTKAKYAGIAMVVLLGSLVGLNVRADEPTPDPTNTPEIPAKAVPLQSSEETLRIIING